MACSLPRSCSGQRSVMSKVFSPSIICVTGLAAHGGGDDVLDVGDADVPALALAAIDGELQVRLPLDAEDAHVLDAAARRRARP